ncbi:hypothetical protein SDC9_116183 [bioreactor metagenome]|uniref:AAA+ ATPase domain-containing protein n=1 Tax=bioreactor metagenome TaxID=1076179 RepID=A0A645BUX8_9ZZZZ
MIEPELARVAKQFPVITIIGPRQSGKTTLAQTHFSDYDYVNLEDLEARGYATEDPKGFLNDHPAPVILDEIQRVPELLSYIQVIADRDKKMGQYILTGSHQPQLRAEVTQSLAGRTGLLQLLPLSIAELNAAGIALSRNEYLHRGFLPKLYDTDGDPILEYRNYYGTYIEKDIRQLIHLQHQREFEVFIRLLAGRIGQLLNLSSLADDVGVSASTLAEWLNVLEASFIVFRLPCYFENFGKRLIKTPKLYFTEVGLASWLLGIKTPEQAGHDPLLGGLFENMVVVEALKARYNSGYDADLYFFRDQRGFEIDLLLADNRKLYPFEIKAGQTYSSDYAANLKIFGERSDRVQPGTVVYSGDMKRSGPLAVINFQEIAQTIAKVQTNASEAK